MNILVTLDKGYLKVLSVMLKSLLISHPEVYFDVYIMHSSLEKEDFDYLKGRLNDSRRMELKSIKADCRMLKDAPVTDRYPKEMYYRIFAADFLPPTVDRVLYLDPDLVVLKNLEELYHMDMEDSFYAAASHVGRLLTNINALRLQMDEDAPYINSGVMLMNIRLLRRRQDTESVLEYIDKNKRLLFLPDQDVISGLYGGKIIRINPFIYNMTERLLLHPYSIENHIDSRWVRQNSAIVHYCGRNKPWKPHYIGTLKELYHEVENAPAPR